MKRLISLGVVSTMVASMSAVSFAVDANSSNVNEAFVLWNGNITLGKKTIASGNSSGTNGLLTLKRAGTVINGVTMNEDFYLLEGNNTDVANVVFGASSTELVVNSAGASKGNNFKGINPLKSSISNLSYTKNSTFTSNAISITKGTYSVNVGSGDYSYVLGFKINLNNKSKLDAYAMYDLTVAGKSFKFVVHSFANDTADTSAAMYEPDENGIRPYGGPDAKYANGTVIYAPTLKVMYDNGDTYGIQMKNGLSLIISKVLKATSEAGNLTLNYNIGKDAALTDKYAELAGGNPLVLDIINGFTNEAMKYNIDLSNTEVLKAITDAQIDRWIDGKRVFAYVVNKANLTTTANASTTDGIINSERMIVGKIVDGKIVFDVPAKYFDNTKEKLMITLQEIDFSNLKTVSEDVTSAANEITAPIVATNESTSNINIASATTPITAPEVVSAPVLTEKPAATNAGTQNTGVARGMVACACAAIMAMAAAVVTTVSKKSFKRF